MSFFDVVSDISTVKVTKDQAEELQAELKDLDKFFNEKFEDTDTFANLFFDKFESLATKYGFHDGVQEALVETLYFFQSDDFKDLAINITVIGRKVTQSEFSDYVYEQMMIEMRNDFDEE